MGVIEAVLAFLNLFYVKAIMVGAGTYIMRKIPRVVNEAAPFWTGVYSIGTAILGNLFPGQVHASGLTHVGVYAFAVAASAAPWWQLLLMGLVRDGILPWLTGFGGQRATAQTFMFGKGKTINRTPVAIKPFQTNLTDPQLKKSETAANK